MHWRPKKYYQTTEGRIAVGVGVGWDAIYLLDVKGTPGESHSNHRFTTPI